jgi:hypothetical protein
MAKLIGPFEIEGTFGTLTFYKTKFGNIVRAKGGISGNRIGKDPKFKLVRENNAEFSHVARAGKLLRHSILYAKAITTDSMVTSRLTKLLHSVKSQDTKSDHGNRKVSIGLTKAVGRQNLLNFNFNCEADLLKLLKIIPKVDLKNGQIVLNDFIPTLHLHAPEKATHVAFTGGMTRIDFDESTHETSLSGTITLPIDGKMKQVKLTPKHVPKGKGNVILFLALEFMQEFNGRFGKMGNSGCSMAIVGVR